MEKILICNHKMYLTHDEAYNLAADMKTLDTNDAHLVVCPSFLNFDLFNDYELGAQDAYYEDKGPYTGEVSAYDLSLRKIEYVIVGHSERREIDTDEIINKKIKAVLNNGMTPILCIGETKIEKELMKTPEVLKRQLTKAFKDIALEPYQQVFIAYEPRFLISGNKAINKDEIEDVILYIKKVLEMLNIANYKILYGGGVNKENINNIKSNLVDGYLIGGASTNFVELKNILECIK